MCLSAAISLSRSDGFRTSLSTKTLGSTLPVSIGSPHFSHFIPHPPHLLKILAQYDEIVNDWANTTGRLDLMSSFFAAPHLARMLVFFMMNNCRHEVVAGG
jgi:hypothetical protein